MKSEYTPSEEKIGPYKTIKCKKTEETFSVGKFGIIWEWSDDNSDQLYYSVLITSSRLANLHLKSKTKWKNGEEALIKISAVALTKWGSRLKICKGQATMIKVWEKYVSR